VGVLFSGEGGIGGVEMPGNANNFRSGSWYAIAITFGTAYQNDAYLEWGRVGCDLSPRLPILHNHHRTLVGMIL